MYVHTLSNFTGFQRKLKSLNINFEIQKNSENESNFYYVNVLHEKKVCNLNLTLFSFLGIKILFIIYYLLKIDNK